MSTRSCSYEITPPVRLTDLNRATVHPDPDIYARMATVARQHQARRFALCRLLTAQAPNGQAGVMVECVGWQYKNGVTITDLHGHPIGWYTSVDSAHHHLTAKRATQLWLVWLEPAARFTNAEQGAAGMEASHNEPEMFYAGLGFAASGPEDARLHAMRLVEAAESFLPDVQRQACITGSDKYGIKSVYCSQFGCLKPAAHPGDHHISATEPPGHKPPKFTADDLNIPEDQQRVLDETTKAAPDTDQAASATATATDGDTDTANPHQPDTITANGEPLSAPDTTAQSDASGAADTATQAEASTPDIPAHDSDYGQGGDVS